MCEEFYHYHICWLLTIRVTVVFGLFFKIFLAFSECEGILMKDERRDGAQTRWEKASVFSSNVKMTACLGPLHNDDSDTPCCKMRHFTKVACGICLDFYTQD